MARKIRVLIAEDHDVVREGLKFLIGTEPDLEIAGEAENGVSALQMARKLRPDVVLMDVAMPRCNGLEATQNISKQVPASKVLILSASNDEDSVRRLLDAGASGYLTKNSAAEELLDAIREVNRGGSFLSSSMARRLRNQSQTAFINGRSSQKPRSLTPRETEVLGHIAAGLCNKQIAVELGLSIKTIEKHRQAVMDKLGIHDIAGLTRYAISRGLTPCLKRPVQQQLL